MKEHKPGEKEGGEPVGHQAAPDAKKRRVNWEDPSVPIGNAPPLPRWPLVVAAVAWLASVVFLVVMMLAGDGSGAV